MHEARALAVGLALMRTPLLFGTFTELSASSKDSSAARTCTRTCGAPIYDCPFSRLDSECHERTNRVGAHQGCRVNTEGLWGIWRARCPRAAYRQARLCRAAFTHTHTHIHTALIAFASFITFIASSLHCVLPGLVERSLWRRRRAHTIGLSVEQEMAAGAPENAPIAMGLILFFKTIIISK